MALASARPPLAPDVMEAPKTAATSTTSTRNKRKNRKGNGDCFIELNIEFSRVGDNELQCVKSKCNRRRRRRWRRRWRRQFSRFLLFFWFSCFLSTERPLTFDLTAFIDRWLTPSLMAAMRAVSEPFQSSFRAVPRPHQISWLIGGCQPEFNSHPVTFSRRKQTKEKRYSNAAFKRPISYLINSNYRRDSYAAVSLVMIDELLRFIALIDLNSMALHSASLATQSSFFRKCNFGGFEPNWPLDFRTEGFEAFEWVNDALQFSFTS